MTADLASAEGAVVLSCAERSIAPFDEAPIIVSTKYGSCRLHVSHYSPVRWGIRTLSRGQGAL